MHLFTHCCCCCYRYSCTTLSSIKWECHIMSKSSFLLYFYRGSLYLLEVRIQCIGINGIFDESTKAVVCCSWQTFSLNNWGQGTEAFHKGKFHNPCFSMASHINFLGNCH